MEYQTSIINENWWDFTSLDKSISEKASSLLPEELLKLANSRCEVKLYSNLDDMFLSQALEYITSWNKSTESKPGGICGPVGPTRQMPIVAKLVNELDINLRHCHFWGMDEWVENDKTVDATHPLSFTGANLRLWYNKIRPELRMPEEQLHFPTTDNLEAFSRSFDEYHCYKMQGGLGHTLHWAFNDPMPRTESNFTQPISAKSYQEFGARRVQLHPISQIQNSTGLTGRNLVKVPTEAVTVGPKETFKCDEVSIWYPGHNQNPFGIRLAIYMVANNIQSSVVPISVLAEHKKITFHVYAPSLTDCTPIIV